MLQLFLENLTRVTENIQLLDREWMSSNWRIQLTTSKLKTNDWTDSVKIEKTKIVTESLNQNKNRFTIFEKDFVKRFGAEMKRFELLRRY